MQGFKSCCRTVRTTLRLAAISSVPHSRILYCSHKVLFITLSKKMARFFKPGFLYFIGLVEARWD